MDKKLKPQIQLQSPSNVGFDIGVKEPSDEQQSKM